MVKEELLWQPQQGKSRNIGTLHFTLSWDTELKVYTFGGLMNSATERT